MRFCGMCGTPLPYRPLTTPEAQSTLKYTRLPLEEAGDTREHTGKPVSSSATMVLPERPGGGNGKPISTATIATKPQSEVARARATFEPQARTVERPSMEAPEVEPPARIERATRVTEDWRPRETEAPPEPERRAAPEAVAAHPVEAQAEPLPATTEWVQAPAETHAPQPSDMVPDVPFDEYLRSFHYQPPSEPTEVTMRDTSVAEERVPEHISQEVVDPTPLEPYSAISPSYAEAEAETEAQQVSSGREGETVAESAAEAAASRDVQDRLGLDATAAPEVVERSRFLDIHEASEREDHAKSGTSTIVGPSFLGLSDAPEVAETAGYEDDELPHRSHWRGWLAAAVVLIFAGLGYMEWRTQVNQTDNGPVEIMKTKIRNWTSGGTAPASETAGPDAPAASNTKPQMEVQEKPKTEQPSQQPSSNAPESAVNHSSAAAAPTTQTNSPQTDAASSQPAAQSSGDGAAAKQSQPTNSAQAAPERAKSSRASAAGTDQQAGKQAPGTDELKKAANASDSAAAAAWLWKSTAKGNPDAPVQLADMYVKGEGVPRSCEQAVVLLKTAAEKENARARNRLASMYAAGNCVQRNRVEAYRWLSAALAANPHSDWAQQNKDLIWNQMTPDERVMAAKYR
jgi:hypothetical protein